MGWDPAHIFPGPLEHDRTRTVKHLLENYRQRCLSTCLLYPTFRSSSVIMTLNPFGTVTHQAPATLMAPPPPPLSPPSSIQEDARLRHATARPIASSPRRPRRPPDEGPAFLRFWRNEATRGAFLSRLPAEDLASLRRACHDFSERAAPYLFADVTVTFRASSFSKPARMASLERIGQHVRAFRLVVPHTAESFLAPLLDAVTGEERVFLYEPSLAPGRPSSGSRPASAAAKYGTWAMTDLLIKQYGPLFHAASDVPAFVRAFSALPGLQHLTLSCPGQEPAQRYRRSAVDYALISVRMAVERAPLTALRSLSLQAVHPGALLYLRPGSVGFGARPSASRRWAQIRHLRLHLDGWPFDAPHPATDHLKLLHSYLLCFAPRLDSLVFRWCGDRPGPCPFMLDTEPVLLRQQRLPGPAVSASSALSWGRLSPIYFPRLRCLELAHARPHAAQLNRFIHRHRRTLQDCSFHAVHLRSGSWHEALDVLTRISGSEKWKEGLQADRDGPRPEMPPSPMPPLSPPPVPALPSPTKPTMAGGG
ncbi:MAG: hypothetical protein M1826_003801 [Phylliscum demangeonii]|nr:MAG: hypothetical protein M1826_003801 [Phylliscum demangeonii]